MICLRLGGKKKTLTPILGTPRAAHSAKFWISSNADGAMINIPINNGTKWSRGFVWTCCGRDTVKQAGDPIGCVAGYHVPFDFRI